MPYSSISELPDFIKKYSHEVQRQYLHVWNSVYHKLLKEGVDHKKAEQRAFMAAASVLKKRFKNKEQSWAKNDSDYINVLIDTWLGNLKG